MRKAFTGICPVQGNEYTIYIDYIDASDLDEKIYEKGLATCNYNIRGDKCKPSECPIIKSAPETL